ncbi:GUN4 domain-containing protein, partial [Nodularia spumigena CS-590/02]|uniref:GUN4 domain-containing protein n=1 Tax=Nodularia spumigena TaxID=70799 RepID=UPI00232CF506
PLPKKTTRRGFMQLAGLVVGLLVLAVVGQNIIRDNSTPTSEPILRRDRELRSSVGVDYTKLQNLLAARTWKQADEETERVVLAVANREKEGRLDTKHIENLPCQDLSTIDQLWVESSDGRFGFSVQKRIYQSLGGTSDVNMSIWLAFGDRVGWRKAGDWLTSNHSQLTFDTTASQGHLPALVVVRLPGFWGPTSLMSKLETCGL